MLRKSLDAHAIDRARQQVRRMTRALGPVRELDVALLHLDEFANRGVATGRAMAAVRQALTSERLGRRREMLTDITPGKVEQLTARAAHGRLGAAGRRPARGDQRRGAGRSNGGRGAWPPRSSSAGSLYVAERLHAGARRRQEAALRDGNRTRAEALAHHRAHRPLKPLQDVLGQMHDFEMLVEQAAAGAGRPRRHRSARSRPSSMAGRGASKKSAGRSTPAICGGARRSSSSVRIATLGDRPRPAAVA